MAEFENIEIGKLILRFNQPEREISVHLPIEGGTATLISKQVDIKLFEVRFEIENKKLFHFKIDKILTAIGSNNKSKYYKLLCGNMEKHGIIPDFEGEDFKEKFDAFVFELQTADGDVCSVMNSSKWQRGDREEKKLSWAVASGSMEKFPKEIIDEATELIKKGDLIEEMLDLSELKAVGQRDNTALVILIAFSSFLEDSIHHISTGPPGTSKSTITDTIFSMFPKQRKESIGKGSTPASLSNMTIYEEGPKVLSKKFIRVGDLGNNEEIKAALPLLSIFKELMSDKRYDKTISVAQGDSHITQKLTLEGIGSVHLSTIESNVESQFDSRTIISSPDDNTETAQKIKEYQLDDVQRLIKQKRFNERRPVIAAAIEILCHQIEAMEKVHGAIQFINPYAANMNEIFNVDASKNVNRDRNHIRDLPKSVTLANIKKRVVCIHKKDKDIKIVITPEDYIYALKIIGKPIMKMLADVSPQQQSYIRYINEHCLTTESQLETYNDFETHEIELKQDGWLNKTKENPCFTMRDIKEGLGVSDSTASRILNGLVEKKILYKHLLGKRNYFFPTHGFYHYSKNFSPEFYSDEELKIGGQIHQMAVIEYKAAFKRLAEAGYKVPRIIQSTIGENKTHLGKK